MDYQTVALVIIGVAQLLVIPLVRTVAANSRRIDACASVEIVDRQAARLAALEATHAAVDMHSELARVHARVDDVAERTAEIAGAMAQANRTLSLINQHMLERDRP